jgi:hypothetical protein
MPGAGRFHRPDTKAPEDSGILRYREYWNSSDTDLIIRRVSRQRFDIDFDGELMVYLFSRVLKDIGHHLSSENAAKKPPTRHAIAASHVAYVAHGHNPETVLQHFSRPGRNPTAVAVLAASEARRARMVVLNRDQENRRLNRMQSPSAGADADQPVDDGV